MPRAATIIDDDDDDGGSSYDAPVDITNGLAGRSDGPRGTDSRPSGRELQSEPAVEYEIVEADDNLQPIQRRQANDDQPEPQQREAPLDDDEGDGTYVDRQNREQQPQHQRLGAREQRERRRRGRERTLQENAQLRAQLEEVQNRLAAVEPRLNEFDQSRVQQQIVDLDRQRQALLDNADRELGRFIEATQAADTATAQTALKNQQAAIMQASRLEVQRNMLADGNPLGRDGAQIMGLRRPEPQQTQAPQAPRPWPIEAQRNAERFRQEHDWLNYKMQRAPNGQVVPVPNDMDTRVMSQIDAAIMEGGFDPRYDEYWQELEDRARQYLPHRFAPAPRRSVAETQRGDGRNPPAPQARPERRGPPVAGGTDRTPPPAAGKQRVYLNEGRKSAMILAGALGRDGRTIENPEKYQRLMRSYAKYDNDPANAANR